MKENNENKEVEILKGNEFYVNYFLHKMYGPKDNASKPLTLQNERPLYTKEESRKKIVFLEGINPVIKKELTHLATNRELTKYMTIPKIEKIVKNFKTLGGNF